MPRYTHIQSAAFAEVALPLPMSAVVTRRCQTHPRAGDLDAHPSSVQTRPLPTTVELTVRDVSAVDGLTIGARGALAIEVAAGDGETPGRSVSLSGAVLTHVETRYAQNAPAVAVLHFACESTDGTSDPFLAEDQT